RPPRRRRPVPLPAKPPPLGECERLWPWQRPFAVKRKNGVAGANPLFCAISPAPLFLKPHSTFGHLYARPPPKRQSNFDGSRRTRLCQDSVPARGKPNGKARFRHELPFHVGPVSGCSS